GLAGVAKMIVCLSVRGGEAPQLKSVHIDGRVTQVRIQCRHYDVVVRIDGDGSTTGVDSTGTRVGPEPPQAIAEGRVQAQIGVEAHQGHQQLAAAREPVPHHDNLAVALHGDAGEAVLGAQNELPVRVVNLETQINVRQIDPVGFHRSVRVNVPEPD